MADIQMLWPMPAPRPSHVSALPTVPTALPSIAEAAAAAAKEGHRSRRHRRSRSSSGTGSITGSSGSRLSSTGSLRSGTGMARTPSAPGSLPGVVEEVRLGLRDPGTISRHCMCRTDSGGFYSFSCAGVVGHA
mmetsp:Transcript_51764/g.110738  ORF Transcript_51764/g.110738 Transcript_51764/m.110738 type:complete len:133 (+) Transcript_51764:92-490(+)